MTTENFLATVTKMVNQSEKEIGRALEKEDNIQLKSDLEERLENIQNAGRKAKAIYETAINNAISNMKSHRDPYLVHFAEMLRTLTLK